MLKRENLHSFQKTAVEHIIEVKRSLLFIDPGLGKTAAVLTAVNDLMFDCFRVKGVLVVAPLRVCQSVWEREACKWEHLDHLQFSSILGNQSERIRGMGKRSNIWLVNYENLQWLWTECESRMKHGLPWNMVVFDECSKLKNTRWRQGTRSGQAALRFSAIAEYAVGMTGTPASNGLQDVFGQVLAVDLGETLGTSFSVFRSTYFYQTDFRGYKWKPFEQSESQIADKLAGLTLNFKAEDFLDLPNFTENKIEIALPPKLQYQYDSIESRMILELENDTLDIENRASAINRCQQFAGGAVYKTPGLPQWEKIHDIKLKTFIDLVDELEGQPVLVLYGFQHEAQRIMKQYPDAVWLSSKMSEADFKDTLLRWKMGELQMIVGHPASMGHGVDGLQDVCHTLIWYSLPWSLELYDQANMRINRQGQTKPVIAHQLIVKDTIDEAIDTALKSKSTDELSVRESISRYIKQKKEN